MTATGTAMDLHDVPERLIPHEPRLGGSCVPVPARRLAALTSSGPVLLGRHDGQPAVDFHASVVGELRQLMRLPEQHRCVVLPAPPDVVYRAVVLEDWATGLTVVGQGEAAARWRTLVSAGRDLPVRAATVAPAPQAVGVVLREHPDTAVGARTADGWVAADLSRTSGPVTDPAFARLDVGFFCPSWLFGVPPGSTVLVLSERAVAAARSRHDALGGAGLLLPTVHALGTAGGTTGMTDLVMLAHAVRERLEAEPGALEAAVQSRYRLVAEWAAALPWADCAPRRPGGDLTALVRTGLDGGVLHHLDAFLAEHHLGYGVVEAREPGCLRLGLADTVPVTELTRLLELVELVVARLTGGSRR